MFEIEAIKLGVPLKSAVVWSVVADLFRFHGRSMGLRVTTSCPEHMGGLYFFVTVASSRTGRKILWNLGGTTVLEKGGAEPLFPRGSPPGKYLEVALCHGSRSLLKRVEDVLGCGPRPEMPHQTTPESLCFRAIALLMRDRALWDTTPGLPLIARSASEDDPSPLAEYFPALARAIDDAQRSGDEERAAHVESRGWSLQRNEHRVVLDVATAEAVEPGGRRTSLWDLYESRGRDVWSVVSWLDARL